MGNVFFFAWEPALIEWLQTSLEGFGITLMYLVSIFGEELMLVAILGFFYWCWNKRMGISVGLGLLTASVWNPMVKNIALRLRPYMVHDNIRYLKKVDAKADIMDVASQGYSFPSGHSANSSATYLGAARQLKKKVFWVIAVVLTLLVGISRFTLGVHYPTDVLAGWALGLLAVTVTGLLEKHVQKRWLLYGILFLTVLPGLFYCRTHDYFSSLGMLAGLALGDLFERKYVHFENTRRIVPMLLRLAGGFALYVGLNTLLKMPFSKDFLSSATAGAFAVRCLRYLIVTFLLIGPYPMLFGKLKFLNPDKKEN